MGILIHGQAGRMPPVLHALVGRGLSRPRLKAIPPRMASRELGSACHRMGRWRRQKRCQPSC